MVDCRLWMGSRTALAYCQGWLTTMVHGSMQLGAIDDDVKWWVVRGWWLVVSSASWMVGGR